MLKHRIGAADAASNEEEKVIATAFGKRFCIALDFELKKVTCLLPRGLGDRLEYELTFNDFIKSLH